MNKDEFYMNKAFNLAKRAIKKEEVPVGAILVYKDKIIASAYNKKDTKKSVLKHAELICIEKASRKLNNWRLNECILYVTLEPCPMCASAIQQARIKRIAYGTQSKNNKNKEIVHKILTEVDANSAVEITCGILENECASLLSNFFKKKRN